MNYPNDSARLKSARDKAAEDYREAYLDLMVAQAHANKLPDLRRRAAEALKRSQQLEGAWTRLTQMGDLH